MLALRKIVAVATVSCVALMAAQAANAGAFGIREQSATAQGLSFAGVASGSGGLSSMFWNPSTITMSPGWQGEWHASLIIPQARIKPEAPTPTLFFGPSGDVGQDALLPASYSTYQVNDRLWLGLATTSPFGLITKPNQAWAGQVYSRSSEIFSINVNPTVGYKLTDWLSIGGGPVFQYFKVQLKRASPSSPLPAAAGTALLPTAPSAILDGDDIGIGFTAGLTLTPFAGTSIGVGFRSAIDHELEGGLELPYAYAPVKAKLTLPESLNVGLSQQITPDLKVHAGFEWTNWSRLKTSAVVGPAGPIAGAEIELNYKDGYFYSIGAEYAINPALTVRAGLAYEQSPIDTQVRSTRLPDNDRIWASVGLGYKWSDKLSFDVGYTHIFVDDTRIAIVPGHQDYIAGLPFLADVDSSVDIVSVALRYRFDAAAPSVAPSAPIIRKY
jgi:long-chain fatty acid transport protein